MDQRAFLRFYDRFAEFKEKHKETWKDLLVNFYEVEAKRKWKRFPRFMKNLVSKVNGFDGLKKGTKYTHRFFDFPVEGFFALLVEWLSISMAISKQELFLIDTRAVSRGEMMQKIKLSIPIEIVEKMDEIVDFTVISDNNEREFIRLIFEGNCRCFTRILHEAVPSMKSTWCLDQISNLLEVTLDGMDITILLSFNNYSKNNLDHLFFKGNLLDFLRDTLDISVNDDLARNLAAEREKLKEQSVEFFHAKRSQIIGTINHFRYKSILTGHVSHIYEIVSFLISRLDLGVNSIQDLLKRFGEKNGFSEKDTIVYGYLLDFVAKQSLLYTTFQSNNIGLKKKLNQVLVLLLQYYLVDFDKDGFSEKIFQGESLYEKIERLVTKNSKVEGDSMAKFQEFMVAFLLAQFKSFEMDGYSYFINGLFHKKIDVVVFRFFISFLKTSHVQLIHNIERLSSRDEHASLTFEKVVDFLCDFLIFGVEFTFFKPTLEEVSKKFSDPVNRFSPVNVALNMVYLVLYRILPFQDNQWMPTLLMKYRNHLDVMDTLLQAGDIDYSVISPDIATSSFIIHDRALKRTSKLLNQWFFDEIIQPFFFFYTSFETLLEKGDVSSKALVQPALAHLMKESKSIASKISVKENVERILVDVFES